MDKKDIIEALVSHYSGGNKRQFAAKLGCTPQTISTWISRNTFDIDLVFAKCEGISAEWLLTGEGSMLRGGNVQVSGSGNAVVGNSHNSTATVNATPTDTSDLRAMVEEQRTIIEGLQGQLQEKDKQIAQLLAIISKK